MPSVALVSKRHPHHGDRAGYNLLTRQLPEAGLFWAAEGPLARLEGALSRRLLAPLTGSTWLGTGGLRAAARAARWLRGRPQPTLHILYGEDLAGFLPTLRRLSGGAKLVATFHQPPERFAQLVRRPDQLAPLDAAIALDTGNAEALQAHFPRRVHTLWLGIDTDFWRPPSLAPFATQLAGTCPPAQDGAPTVIAVGSHLRDLALLEAVIRRLAPTGVRFELVLPPARCAQLAPLPGTRVRSGISDAALRDAYQRAHVHLLPLKGGSANNALLQAMACGLPTVASALPGVVDYLGPGAGRYAPVGDVQACADALTALLHDAPARAAAGAEARARAEARAWPALAEAHRALYTQLH